MPRRTLLVLGLTYLWLGAVSTFAILEAGPWRWVCELYGFPTKLNPDSLAFALVVLTLSWPVLVLVYLRGEQVERARNQRRSAC